MIYKILSSRFIAIMLFVYALIYAVAVICLRPVNPDMFFILTHGRDILTTGSVPTVLLHTVHDGFATVIPQPATDCLAYVFFRFFNFYGLYFLNIVVFSFTAVTAYIYISRHICYRLEPGIILLSLAIPVMSLFANGRPQMMTQLIFYLLLLTADMEWDRLDIPMRPVMVAWPVLSLLQANFHATLWPFLIFSAVLITLPDIMHPVQAWRSNNPDRLLALFLMLPAGIINPNGIDALTYLIRYELLKGDTVPVSEMQTPSLISISAVYAIISLIVILICIKRFGYRSMCGYLSLSIWTTAMGCLYLRCAWMIAFGMLPLLCTILGEMPFPNTDKEPVITYNESGRVDLRKLFSISGVIFPILASLFFCLAFVVSALFVHSDKMVVDSEPTPLSAYRYLERFEDKDNVRLFTCYNNGAFMEFMGYTIYIDARQEPYTVPINKKEDILGEYVSLSCDYDFDFRSFFNKYDFDYLLVDKSGRLYAYLRRSIGICRVVDMPDYALFKVISCGDI